ncbi:hypothetical protein YASMINEVIRUS_380 [Yasminevirus sp. GU-2018]|uniref:Uncharacterized protein n=1 Tax=Yasminevirus sp. GU-2018 TaxID=2420051 RepID=A0A5K0U7X5_9VIRU|nr:hypothetical protein YASMINEVIRUS_380 [Yasminevirus sp. GU-2018]
MPTYFISGHVNLTEDEFKLHYKKRLDDLIMTKNDKIVVGNANGADKMSFDYLVDNAYPPNLITVFHYGSGVPRSYYVSKGVNVIDGFDSYTKRDSHMTNNSDADILWIRPEDETKAIVEKEGKVYRPGRISGTEINKNRRAKLSRKDIQ